MQTDTLPLGSGLLSACWWHLGSFFHFSGLGFPDSFAAPYASFACLSLRHYLQGSLTLCLPLSVNHLKTVLVWGKVGQPLTHPCACMSHLGPPGSRDTPPLSFICLSSKMCPLSKSFCLFLKSLMCFQRVLVRSLLIQHDIFTIANGVFLAALAAPDDS